MCCWQGWGRRIHPYAGAYLANCRIVAPSPDGENMALAAKLWEVTEQQLAEAEARSAAK